MVRVVALISTLFLMIPFQNCGYVGSSDPDQFLSLGSLSGNSSYADLNSAIFAPKCVGCHGSGVMDVTSYATLMAGDDVVPGDPAASKLYQRLANGSMPSGGPPLSAMELQAVYSWISAGAVEDGGGGGPTGPTPPDAPTSLSATPSSSTTVGLSWTLPAQTLAAIRIYRSTGSGSAYTLIANIAGNNTSYNDTGLTAGTTYYYKVSGTNADGNSPDSNEINVTTP